MNLKIDEEIYREIISVEWKKYPKLTSQESFFSHFYYNLRLFIILNRSQQENDINIWLQYSTIQHLFALFEKKEEKKVTFQAIERKCDDDYFDDNDDW